MSASERDEFQDLFDAYCDDLIDDDGLRRLEAHLLASEAARREFVAAFHLHTELHFAVRARRAVDAALGRMAGESGDDGPVRETSRDAGQAGKRWKARRPPFWVALAAGVLIAAVGFLAGQRGWHSGRPAREAPAGTAVPNVAWLVNAQDCLWDGNARDMPGRDMRAGKVLRLRSGLAEIEFDRGARVILQGPASLELLSGNGARLLRGNLTARVPEAAKGFAVLSPRGKVVDLGTEFGLSVDARGDTAVRVFRGEVEASPLATSTPAVKLLQDQAARIDGRAVAVQPAEQGGEPVQYVRAIEPPPLIVPRTVDLDFTRPLDGSLADADGRGTGLTHRLPGTGGALLDRDENLRLDTARGVLELTTTRSDINTQQGMPTGEYPGFRLADLGFTGREDFAISTTIPQIPGLEMIGQLGLYAGTGSAENIRGGLISQRQPDSYQLFLVNDHLGRDKDLYRVGLMRTGEDLRLTLRRVSGRYSLVVENQTTHSSSTLAIAHPAFLDGEADLYVGLFGANTASEVRKTLTIKHLSVTVWTVSPAETARPTP